MFAMWHEQRKAFYLLALLERKVFVEEPLSVNQSFKVG